MTDRLHTDFETRSRIDLKALGLGPYSRSPSTRVLMQSWAINDGAIKLWLPALGEPEPAELRDARLDPHIEKHAWNAGFERAIYAHVLRVPVAGPWRCTAVLSRYLSLPSDLFSASRIANKHDKNKQKSSDGTRLIRKFCVPNSVSKARPFEWADHTTDPEDWDRFCGYCVQDTESERAFFHIANKYPMPAREWVLYELDHEINERGIRINVAFAEAAFELADRDKKQLKAQLREATGLPNAMGQAAFLAWAREHGYPFNNLQKGWVVKAIDLLEEDDPLRDILAMRVRAGRNTPAKYTTVARIADETDHRARYTIVFRGAQRTGRHAGSKFQPHNLARIQKRFAKHLEAVVEMIEQRDFDLIDLWHGSVVDTVSNVVRCVVQASEGRTLVVCDLNAIENRVLGWLSRCPGILDVFKQGLDPYKAFGVHLFRKAYEALTQEERDKSKPAVLGCGYRLGGGDEVEDSNGDLVKTGLWGYAENMGVKLSREMCHTAVAVWRQLYPEVVQYWYDLEEAVHRVVIGGETVRVGPVVFDKFRAALRIRLPSGRYLHYIEPRYVTQKFRRPKVDEAGEKVLQPDPVTGELVQVWDEWEKQTLSYWGTHQKTKQWARLLTHGGKLAENITQAISCDVLEEGKLNARDDYGFEIVMHVHDEIVAESDPDDIIGLPELSEAMTRPIPWARGLPLAAAGYVSRIYKKE